MDPTFYLYRKYKNNISNYQHYITLGVVDGNTNKCFIMPVQKEDETINSRQEYLLLYPVIGINTFSELRVYDSEYSNYSRPLAECLR